MKNQKCENVFYILFFIFSFPFFALAQEHYFDLAKDKFNQKLYSEAISLLENELNQNNENESAWNLLGRCYFKISDFDKAIYSFEQAQKLNPNDPEPNVWLARAEQAKKEQLESLIQCYLGYLARHPEDDAYRLKLARAYKEYGDYPSAQMEYEIYLDNNPYAEEVKEEYLLLFPEQPCKKTIKRETKTVKPKPKTQNSNSGSNEILAKARNLAGQEKYTQAESLYQTYLTQNPCDTTACREYAQMLSWNKQYIKSIAAYRRLLTLNPNDKNSAYELAQVLSWVKDYDAAIDQYLTLDTTDLKVLSGLAETYYWKGSYYRALEIYERILVLDPKNLEAKKAVSAIKQEIIPSPQFRAEVSNIWDSEEFSFKSFNAALKIALSENTGLEPNYAAKRFEQKDDIIIDNSYGLRITEEFSQTAQGEIHYAYNYYDCVPNTHSYGVILNYTPYPQSYFSFGYDHHDIISDVLTTRSLIQEITTDNFEIQGSYQFEKGYGISGYYLYGMYSDDNRLQNPQARLFYQLFDVLRIGYAYKLISYSNSSPWYWSPEFYQTHSAWFELANGSKTPLSYYVSAEIAKVSNSSKLARTIGASFALTPSDRFTVGISFSYSETGRDFDSPPYWYQSLSAFLQLKL